MTGNRSFSLAHRGAISRVWVCALLSFAIAPASRAAVVLYDFTSPPENLNAGAFDYSAPGAPLASFENLQHDGGGSFPDHTHGTAGVLFGANPAPHDPPDPPSVIRFASPVEFVELFVNNFNGDFDERPTDPNEPIEPTDFKLFTLTASLGGTTVFTYDRAAESAAGQGLAFDYLRIAPAQPVTIDTITLGSFETDVLDDLKVNVVPEPAGVLAWLAGALALSRAGGRGGRRRRDGQRDRKRNSAGVTPPNVTRGARTVEGSSLMDTQANGVACAGLEKILWRVSAGAAVGTCT